MSGINLGKVTLNKTGDRQTINLGKDGGSAKPIHINLNWTGVQIAKKGLLGGLFGGGAPAKPDLDLGCMYRLRDGSKHVIQPLGGNFGSRTESPFIFLDKDDRSGAAADGENLYLVRPEQIDLVMVFAMIYEGADSFQAVQARLLLDDGRGQQIEVRLDNPSERSRFCAIATIRGEGQGVTVTKEERYFAGHEQADRHYGFGFEWRAGSK